MSEAGGGQCAPRELPSVVIAGPETPRQSVARAANLAVVRPSFQFCRVRATCVGRSEARESPSPAPKLRRKEGRTKHSVGGIPITTGWGTIVYKMGG